MSTSCDPFKVHFTGSAADLIQHAKHLLEEHGGTLSGDASSGKFKVTKALFHVSGDYKISGQECTITVTSKTDILPSCSEIESYVKEHLPD